jgi:flagellar basal-body rod modification protein FlgD
VAVEIIKDRYLNNTELIDGVRYTTKEDQNKLSNNDFLMLMLEEMKMQDPTKPMDSAKMMDTQLKMSTIEANIEMSKSMTALQNSYANSALSTASGLIGSIIENGSVSEEGVIKAFKVQNVENKEGTLYINAREMTGYQDTIAFVDDDTKTQILYNTNGNLYDIDGNLTDTKVKLDANGRFDLDNKGKLVLLDENNEVIDDEETLAKYSYTGAIVTYSDEVTSMSLSDVTKVSG